jgi:hypothetical protein
MAAAGNMPRTSERGEITLVGLGMVAAALAGLYLAWMWVPVYVVHYEVKQVVRQLGNQAVHDPHDGPLVEVMVTRLRALDSSERVGDGGERQKVPTVDIAAKDVTWERSADHRLRVAFEYTRTVPYPLLDRSLERTMSVDLTMDVSAPDWGTSR